MRFAIQRNSSNRIVREDVVIYFTRDLEPNSVKTAKGDWSLS